MEYYGYRQDVKFGGFPEGEWISKLLGLFRSLEGMELCPWADDKYRNAFLFLQAIPPKMTKNTLKGLLFREVRPYIMSCQYFIFALQQPN